MPHDPLASPTFGEFVAEYIKGFVATDNLSESTRLKYLRHIKNHLLPAFGEYPIERITTRMVEQWLVDKAANGMAWATRTDLKNLMSAIYTTAQRWEVVPERRNPARLVRVGRRRAARKKRKLSVDETKMILAALRPDVRLIAMVALFCGLRISEVLGLQWEHVDLERGVLLVRQRYYRGDIDKTKSEKSERDVPLGHLVIPLKELRQEHKPEEFVFFVRTCKGVTRSDCSMRRYFLMPVAKSLGLYWCGFGFHAFRREAITAIAAFADPVQAMRLAGHTRMDMTLHYGLTDLERLESAVKQFQEIIGLGGIGEIVSTTKR